MICRIEDEKVYNPHEDGKECNDHMKSTLECTSIYDLMAEDYDIQITRSGNEYDVTLTNEDGLSSRYFSIHPFAIQSLVAFAKQVVESVK